MRVTETAHWLEWQDWADPILAEPFPLENGHLVVPDRPGEGIAWNEKAVAKYSARARGRLPPAVKTFTASAAAVVPFSTPGFRSEQ
jgi:hypothetical protein